MELNFFGNNKERSLRRSLANALYERSRSALCDAASRTIFERGKSVLCTQYSPKKASFLFEFLWYEQGAHFATQPRERSLSEEKAFFATQCREHFYERSRSAL